MKFEVSSLSYTVGAASKMALLPADFGIEIFYEWGGTNYWIENMKKVLKDRKGGFSIHSPFGYCDFALTEDEDELFKFMMEPFAMYHQFNGAHYVVHTNGHIPAEYTEEERAKLRKRVAERLVRFQKICDENGVDMVVENVPDGGHALFNHEQFLALFTENPELSCIIDTGHAHMEKIDMWEVQKTLGSRLKAYHVHDNAGNADSHLPFMSGVAGGIDWERFVEGVVKFTPNAALTFEYNVGRENDYIADREKFLALVEKVSK